MDKKDNNCFLFTTFMMSPKQICIWTYFTLKIYLKSFIFIYKNKQDE